MSLDGAPLDHISKCRNESTWEAREIVVLYYFFLLSIFTIIVYQLVPPHLQGYYYKYRYV